MKGLYFDIVCLGALYEGLYFDIVCLGTLYEGSLFRYWLTLVPYMKGFYFDIGLIWCLI